MNQDELRQALRLELNRLVQVRFEKVVVDTLVAMVERDPEACAWVVQLRGGG